MIKMIKPSFFNINLYTRARDTIARKNRTISQLDRGMDAIEQHIAEAKNEVATLTENKQTVIDEIQILLAEYRKHKTELEAAAVLFRLLEDPHNIAAYDLRELVKRLKWIVDIRQGKAKHLKYHLAQINENARQRLIAISATLLKDDFVSITKYSDLEKKNRELESKYETLEHRYQNMMNEFNQKLKQLEKEIRNETTPRWQYELKRPQARRVPRVSEP